MTSWLLKAQRKLEPPIPIFRIVLHYIYKGAFQFMSCHFDLFFFSANLQKRLVRTDVVPAVSAFQTALEIMTTGAQSQLSVCQKHSDLAFLYSCTFKPQCAMNSKVLGIWSDYKMKGRIHSRRSKKAQKYFGPFDLSDLEKQNSSGTFVLEGLHFVGWKLEDSLNKSQ